MMAESLGVPLHLVHVLEPVGEAMIEPSLARLMRQYQEKEAVQLSEWTKERTTAPVSLAVVKGSPSWELTALAKTASLVVVGSSTLDAFSVGPVAKRVARKSVSDTLVVRRQPRVPYRKVVVAVDFSEQSRAAVNRAFELFPAGDITVLYSMPSRFDSVLAAAGLFHEELEASRAVRLAQAEERMETFTDSWAGKVRSIVVDGPPSETIEEVVRRRGADLVVVGSRGATATRMVLLGTVAEGLVSRAPCDVLVARSKAPFRRP
jgi:nucleotide-binding universal stress UspA family protein